MRKTNVRMLVAATMAAMLLGGCGETPYELTKEEEGVIVNYSAHVLAKYNKGQKDGLTYVDLEEQEIENTETETEQVTESLDTEEPDTPAGGQAGGTDTEEAAPTASFQDVFGTEGLIVSYTGSRIDTSYVESDYYAVDAKPGKTYLIVGINVSNQTEEPMELNVLDVMPEFKATVNGDTTCSSEITILTEDFSTFKDTVEAGQTVETVLLFQIPDTITDVSALGMSVSANGNNYQIILESTEI